MTDRITTTQSSPSTKFTLEGDQYSQNVSANTSVVRVYLRCNNGPSGSTGSYFGDSGTQAGYIAGSEVGSKTGDPFLPSGYAANAQRWRVGPYAKTVSHDSDGNATVQLKMTVDYGSVDYTGTYNLALTRIPQVPGAPGTPSVSSITPTGASFAWTAASRGHDDIDQYKWQVLDSTGTVVATGSPTGLSGTTTVLTPGNPYTVRVQAHNGDGWGAWSTSTPFRTPSGFKIWNGSAWQSTLAYVWNGTAWQPAQVFIWNGSSWKAAG